MAERAFSFSHQARDFRARSDELDAADFAYFGEVGVFGEEAVSGMDGLNVGDLGGADDRGDI